MKNTYSIVSLLSSFVRLSPLHQFWLNLLIPVVGIILFHWTPGAVLFCFVIELINYWLCNTVLLLFFVSNETFKIRIANALKFSFWNIVCLVGFYFAIAHLSDAKDVTMETNITYVQILVITLLYWFHFVLFLRSIKNKNFTSNAIIHDVNIRLTCIYFGMFVIIGYGFIFWTKTKVMNYALVFVMILVKNLADLVLISLKMSRGRKGK
jgi:hypothetical protein